MQAGGRTLLSDSQARVEVGELVLLVGGSGTGKSLLLGILAGLWRPGSGVEVAGQVRVLEQDAMAPHGDRGLPGVGIVFQDFALFDDLPTEDNVRFGIDHRAPGRPPASSDHLLTEFGLPKKVIPARLSGGMRQRLALARLRAQSPGLVLYDEPTSGLDPAMKLRVASRIREVHDQSGQTTVIVTHDLESCLEIADKIILLDPTEKSLVEIPKNKIAKALATLRTPAPEDALEGPTPRGLLRFLIGRFESIGDFVLASSRTVDSLLPQWPAPRWGFHFLRRALRLTTLGSALPFLGLSGLIAGFVTSFFMFALMPVKTYTEPVLAEEYGGSLGFALFRVVIPGMTTLLFASRSGAALAADIGNRALTRQLDALRSFGIPPARYLLTGAVWASLLGIPLLNALAYILARFAATAVFLGTHPGHGPYAFNEDFLRLTGQGAFFPGGVGFVVAKLLLCALGTAGIAYHVGARPKTSGAAVADAVTATIIRATIFTLVVHLIFAFFEF